MPSQCIYFLALLALVLEHGHAGSICGRRDVIHEIQLVDNRETCFRRPYRVLASRNIQQEGAPQPRDWRDGPNIE